MRRFNEGVFELGLLLSEAIVGPKYNDVFALGRMDKVTELFDDEAIVDL